MTSISSTPATTVFVPARVTAGSAGVGLARRGRRRRRRHRLLDGPVGAHVEGRHDRRGRADLLCLHGIGGPRLELRTGGEPHEIGGGHRVGGRPDGQEGGRDHGGESDEAGDPATTPSRPRRCVRRQPCPLDDPAPPSDPGRRRRWRGSRRRRGGLRRSWPGTSPRGGRHRRGPQARGRARPNRAAPVPTTPPRTARTRGSTSPRPSAGGRPPRG